MNWLTEWKRHSIHHNAAYHDFGVYAQLEGFCWACGRTSSYNDKPKDFHGPWMIHRAHIVNQPRLKDRRVVCLLCPLCHDNHDGSVSGNQQITVAHMVHLKQLFDPEYFDPDLLQRCSVRIIPAPQELPGVFLMEFQRRRGLTRQSIMS